MYIFYKEKICLTLLGCLTKEVRIAIITPIDSAFRKLKLFLHAEDERISCFFKNSFFYTINGTKGIIVHIPQGRCSQDVMYVFEGIQVVFFGYAGSLNKEVDIGAILEVKMAIESSINQFILNSISDFRQVKVGYSPCMLGDIAVEYRKLASMLGCDIVEMEIVACARAAIKTNNMFSAFVVVSDIPEVEDFWNLNNKVRSVFKKGKDKLIDYIVDYIKEK